MYVKNVINVSTSILIWFAHNVHYSFFLFHAWITICKTVLKVKLIRWIGWAKLYMALFWCTPNKMLLRCSPVMFFSFTLSTPVSVCALHNEGTHVLQTCYLLNYQFKIGVWHMHLSVHTPSMQVCHYCVWCHQLARLLLICVHMLVEASL